MKKLYSRISTALVHSPMQQSYIEKDNYYMELEQNSVFFLALTPLDNGFRADYGFAHTCDRAWDLFFVRDHGVPPAMQVVRQTQTVHGENDYALLCDRMHDCFFSLQFAPYSALYRRREEDFRAFFAIFASVLRPYGFTCRQMCCQKKLPCGALLRIDCKQSAYPYLAHLTMCVQKDKHKPCADLTLPSACSRLIAWQGMTEEEVRAFAKSLYVHRIEPMIRQALCIGSTPCAIIA